MAKKKKKQGGVHPLLWLILVPVACYVILTQGGRDRAAQPPPTAPPATDAPGPATLTPTNAPPPTPTSGPTDTPAPVVPFVTTGVSAVPLFDDAGQPAGELPGLGATADIVARTADSAWWKVSTPDGEFWVSAAEVGASAVTDAIPVENSFRPPQPAAVCDCGGDRYNCGDPEATQACFDYCRSIGAGDVHGLDADGDGVVCE